MKISRGRFVEDGDAAMRVKNRARALASDAQFQRIHQYKQAHCFVHRASMFLITRSLQASLASARARFPNINR